MKEKKGARFSIKMKILLSSILVNIVICVIMGFVIYNYVHASYANTVMQEEMMTVEELHARGNRLTENIRQQLQANNVPY